MHTVWLYLLDLQPSAGFWLDNLKNLLAKANMYFFSFCINCMIQCMCRETVFRMSDADETCRVLNAEAFLNSDKLNKNCM